MNAIPTTYNGTEYKSRYEAEAAKMINDIGYSFEYEPKSFLLESGIHYMPDFYIESLDLWVEPRGWSYEKGDAQLSEFSAMIATGEVLGDYLVLMPKLVTFTEHHELYGCPHTVGMVSIVQCKECMQYYFMGDGSYKCRNCGKWDGNTHIHKIDYFKCFGDLKEILYGAYNLG